MDVISAIRYEKDTRLFLFSGFPPNEESFFMQKVESLHGRTVYSGRDCYTHCTHVIAKEFSATEKILGGLAGGKWLLSPKYILDSHKEGHWLNEEMYELPDFEEAAKWQRCEKTKRGYGLYAGWKVLVLMDTPQYSKKFRRILAAGGAEIALGEDDLSNLDFVLTTKRMLGQVKAKMDSSIIPLVEFLYIKNTLLFRHDPADLRRCDLRYPQELKGSSKAARSKSSISSETSCSPHRSRTLKRPAAEFSSGNNKKMCSQLKQTNLMQFVKSSVKKPSLSDTVWDGGQNATEKVTTVNKCESLSSQSPSKAPVVYVVLDDDEDQISKERTSKCEVKSNQSDKTLSKGRALYALDGSKAQNSSKNRMPIRHKSESSHCDKALTKNPALNILDGKKSQNSSESRMPVRNKFNQCDKTLSKAPALYILGGSEAQNSSENRTPFRHKSKFNQCDKTLSDAPALYILDGNEAQKSSKNRMPFSHDSNSSQFDKTLMNAPALYVLDNEAQNSSENKTPFRRKFNSSQCDKTLSKAPALYILDGTKAQNSSENRMPFRRKSNSSQCDKTLSNAPALYIVDDNKAKNSSGNRTTFRRKSNSSHSNAALSSTPELYVLDDPEEKNVTKKRIKFKPEPKSSQSDETRSNDPPLYVLNIEAQISSGNRTTLNHKSNSSHSNEALSNSPGLYVLDDIEDQKCPKNRTSFRHKSKSSYCDKTLSNAPAFGLLEGHEKNAPALYVLDGNKAQNSKNRTPYRHKSKSSYCDAALSTPPVVYDVEDSSQNQLLAKISGSVTVRRIKEKTSEEKLLNPLLCTPVVYESKSSQSDNTPLVDSVINDVQDDNQAEDWLESNNVNLTRDNKMKAPEGNRTLNPSSNTLVVCESKHSHCDNTPSVAPVIPKMRDDSRNNDGLQNSNIEKTKKMEKKTFEDETLLNVSSGSSVVHKVKGITENQGRLNSTNINEIQQTETYIYEDVTPVNTSPMLEKMMGKTVQQYGAKSKYDTKIQQTEEAASKNVTTQKASSDVIALNVNAYNLKLKEFHVCLGKRINFSNTNLNINYHLPICNTLQSKELENNVEVFNRQLLEDTGANSLQSKELEKNAKVFNRQPLEDTGANSLQSKELEKNAKVFNRQPLKDAGAEQAKDDAKMENPLRLIRKENGEQTSFSEQAQPKPSPHTVTKTQIRNAFVQVLRKRNLLKEICGTSMLCIPKVSEDVRNARYIPFVIDINSDLALNEAYNQQVAYQCRELTKRELHFYTCCTDDDITEKEQLVNGMDTLLLQLSSYLYPPPKILGRLLNFVVESQFPSVHSRSLRVIYKLLSLHPPLSVKMRDYYLSGLEHAVKRDDEGSYVAWKFVRNIIELASSVESDKSWGNRKVEEEEVFDEVSRALNLLQFIVLLLAEDVKHFKHGDTVEDLLTWKIFWGSNEFLSQSPPVNQLLRLWMSQEVTSPALKWHLSHMVSILLEVLWKLSGHPLVPVETLPDSLSVIQKGMRKLEVLSKQQQLELIWRLPTPWAQTVIAFMIAKEIAHCSNDITLSSIMSNFKQTVKEDSITQVHKAEPDKEVSSSSLSVLKKHKQERKMEELSSDRKQIDTKGETPIMRACRRNDVKELALILKQPNVDMNLRDHSGRTPLHEAALRGSLECVKYLLSTLHNKSKDAPRIKIQARDNKMKTPLHDAIIGNCCEAVYLLLYIGGRKLLKDTTIDGQTVFDLTSNTEIINLLRTYHETGKLRTANYNAEAESEHVELFLTLASSYMEISCFRHVMFKFKRCKNENITKMAQHIKLVEDENSKDTCISEHEKSAVDKMYKCFKQGQEAYRKLFMYFPTFRRKDTKNFFKILYL